MSRGCDRCRSTRPHWPRCARQQPERAEGGPVVPVQVKGEVLDNRRVGAYHVLSLDGPGHLGDDPPRSLRHPRHRWRGVEHAAAPRVRHAPGAVARGLRRHAGRRHRAFHGKGTRWLSERRRHDAIDIVGPLGRPFILPKERVACVLVGGGYGSAPLFMLAEQLRERGCRVDVVVGAATEEKLFGTLELKRLASTLTITTDDGSLGERGRVTDVLPEIMDQVDAAVVYACGPDADAAAGGGDRRGAAGLHASARSRRRWPAASASA